MGNCLSKLADNAEITAPRDLTRDNLSSDHYKTTHTQLVPGWQYFDAGGHQDELELSGFSDVSNDHLVNDGGRHETLSSGSKLSESYDSATCSQASDDCGDEVLSGLPSSGSNVLLCDATGQLIPCDSPTKVIVPSCVPS